MHGGVVICVSILLLSPTTHPDQLFHTMTTPVVIQGTLVSNPHAGFGQNLGQVAAEPSQPSVFSGVRGEKQETKCRDPIFAVLFYAFLITIVAIAAVFGPDAISGGQGETEFEGFVIATCIIVMVSFLMSGIGMAIMMMIPETLIKVSLIFVVCLAGAWMVFGFLSGEVFLGAMGFIFFAISLCYARAVWSRIPFATANLVTACTAIKANLGVAAYAYMFTIFAGAWSIAWSLAFAGVYDKTYECDELDVCSDPSYGSLFGLLLAYFFVHQVLQVRLFFWLVVGSFASYSQSVHS